jgi:hypothetical protein
MSPTTRITHALGDGVRRTAQFTTDRGTLVRFSVVLSAWYDDAWHTVRVYDNAHGVNEMHRHTLSQGEQPAEVFHHSTASEAYVAAWRAVKKGHKEMITGWLT